MSSGLVDGPKVKYHSIVLDIRDLYLEDSEEKFIALQEPPICINVTFEDGAFTSLPSSYQKTNRHLSIGTKNKNPG